MFLGKRMIGMTDILFSGGAPGADQLFGKLAKAAGHKVVHFSFEGHHEGIENRFPLSIRNLLVADTYLQDANKLLQRTFPTKTSDVNNLLRRNYYQVYDTERVYAATELDEKGRPKGGTAWAVVMAIQLSVPEIYVFDTVWKKFSHLDKNRLIWEINKPTRPQGKYTGIGSRPKNLSPEAIQAITDLYRE
jgi:hypothetical protein